MRGLGAIIVLRIRSDGEHEGGSFNLDEIDYDLLPWLKMTLESLCVGCSTCLLISAILPFVVRQASMHEGDSISSSKAKQRNAFYYPPLSLYLPLK
jgi:hypothetical protein